MIKISRLRLTGLAFGLASILLGCGGGGSSDGGTKDTSGEVTVKKGTGYYVDSAVQGVSYICGTESGVTTDEGAFTFEEGSNCSFSLGGVTLREVNASELVDGETVFEDNEITARLLQSLDNDGDPSNGITISDEVQASVSSSALTAIPQGADLDVLVASVGNNVSSFEGRVMSEEETQSHLTQTQTEITKARLAGKSFFFYDAESNVVMEVSFNAEVDTLTTSDEGALPITIAGNKLTFNEETDGSYSIITEALDHLVFTNYKADGTLAGEALKLYSNRADAEALIPEVVSPHAEGQTEITSPAREEVISPTSSNANHSNSGFTAELIQGKVLYHLAYVEEDGTKGYAKVTFNSATSLTRHEVAVSAMGMVTGEDTFDVSFSLEDGKMKMDAGSDYRFWELNSQTDTQWHISEQKDAGKDGTIDSSKSSILYLSKPATYPASL